MPIRTLVHDRHKVLIRPRLLPSHHLDEDTAKRPDIDLGAVSMALARYDLRSHPGDMALQARCVMFENTNIRCDVDLSVSQKNQYTDITRTIEIRDAKVRKLA